MSGMRMSVMRQPLLRRGQAGKKGGRRVVKAHGKPAELSRKASDWRTASSSSTIWTTPVRSSDGCPPRRPISRVKRNTVPPPGLGSAHISPPCASMMRFEIDSPTPMPAGLVVTKG